jgi:Tfp pilus assembly protein PilX
MARLRGEAGFTMVAMMGSIVIISLFTISALAVAQNDLPISRKDQDSKQAYAAAEAGIADYFFHLSQDNAYWAKCTSVTQPSAINQAWNGVGVDPRGAPSKGASSASNPYRNVAGSSAWYTLELLPANGSTSCSTADAQNTMIDATSGTFRIRATGHSRNAKRSLVATFKRKNFLDYLYFTDYETADPTWYTLDTNGHATRSGTSPTWSGPDYVTWGSQNCPVYWRQGRGNLSYTGQIFQSGSWQTFSDNCTEIQFAPSDKINGPFHTNDEILVCGSPDFGRNAQDRIEVSGAGWRGNSGCSGNNPTFVGTWTPNAPLLTLPPTDNSLSTIAASSYRFTGRTTIVLNGANMTVTNSTMGLNNVSMALPSNGVIWVANGTCGQGYNPLDPYNAPQGCADVYLKGTYASDLTVGSEKDIIVNGNITKSGDTMLGLIANNFVRIYHPETHNDANDAFNCSDQSGIMSNVSIDAAILSLQHSFTVDNYYCGSPLNTLTVNGVIGQKFRGPVGRGSGGTVVNGYTKNYNYDDRMRFRSPPHFLDPVQAAWRVSRYTEQVPPR